jgi:hypothetical protein
MRRFIAIFVAWTLASPVLAQPAPNHRALDANAVTVAATAVTALTGPANGCNISSAVGLIIDRVGTAGTTVAGTSQSQPAGAAPYQCGPVPAGATVSVNCAGGGTCTFAGDRW